MIDGIPTRLFAVASNADSVYLFQMELLGTFLAAVAFGIIVVLLVSTMQVLLGDTCIYSKPMRTSLLCYIFFMFLLAFLASVQQIAFVIRRVLVLPGVASPSSDASLPQLYQTFALPFCIWGADAFLVCLLTVVNLNKTTKNLTRSGDARCCTKESQDRGQSFYSFCCLLCLSAL